MIKDSSENMTGWRCKDRWKPAKSTPTGHKVKKKTKTPSKSCWSGQGRSLSHISGRQHPPLQPCRRTRRRSVKNCIIPTALEEQDQLQLQQ
ncbi:unnamed protein product [Lactuca virosa]|uniref:Uncharacterized protein n=1 Tax=Lactuca virosa TaxID=75947 RepID=A0AAU9N2X0_9ASTR|nr:unnamed protein product [Lactuca virosa]